MVPVPVAVESQVETYKLRRLRGRVGRGVSEACRCDIAAILKHDSDESPYCVYNEFVATQLAATWGAPIARGLLIVGALGLGFASLEAGAPGLFLSNMGPLTHRRVLARYARQCARLLVFDEWIGNRDRLGNVRAAIGSNEVRLFVGFDQAQALLSCEDAPSGSIEQLRTAKAIARPTHPFRAEVAPDAGAFRAHVATAVQACREVPAAAVIEACNVTHPALGVSLRLRTALAEALVHRQKHLREILG